MKVDKPDVQGKHEGFEKPVPGWHLFRIEEGIGLLMKKSKDGGDDELAKNADGDQLVKLTCVIDDENDEQNGVKYDIIVAENAKGEKLLVNYIVAANLTFWEKLSKKYVGDISIFAEECMLDGKKAEGPWKKVVTNLPKSVVKFKIKNNPNKKDPDNPYVNIEAWGPATKSNEQLDKELYGDKGGKKKDAKAATPAPEDDDF